MIEEPERLRKQHRLHVKSVEYPIGKHFLGMFCVEHPSCTSGDSLRTSGTRQCDHTWVLLHSSTALLPLPITVFPKPSPPGVTETPPPPTGGIRGDGPPGSPTTVAMPGPATKNISNHVKK